MESASLCLSLIFTHFTPPPPPPMLPGCFEVRLIPAITGELGLSPGTLRPPMTHSSFVFFFFNIWLQTFHKSLFFFFCFSFSCANNSRLAPWRGRHALKWSKGFNKGCRLHSECHVTFGWYVWWGLLWGLRWFYSRSPVSFPSCFFPLGSWGGGGGAAGAGYSLSRAARNK